MNIITTLFITALSCFENNQQTDIRLFVGYFENKFVFVKKRKKSENRGFKRSLLGFYTEKPKQPH